jgi:hypothetical protein
MVPHTGDFLMSQTHSIVCHETKEMLWIGQGNGWLATFYTGEPETMEALRWFLVKNGEHALNLVCCDTDEACVDYACWSGVYCDWRIKEDGVDLGVFSGTLPQAIRRATGVCHHFFPSNIEYEMVKEDASGVRAKRDDGKSTKTKSCYDFETLRDAQVFFNRKDVAECDVKIVGAYGGDEPTEDDSPVFMWRA